MRTGLKIATFAAGLAATFGSAYAVGGALDPVAAPKEPSHQESGEGHGEKERPAATGFSPNSPRTGRTPRTSPSALTSPSPATPAPSRSRKPSGR